MKLAAEGHQYYVTASYTELSFSVQEQSWISYSSHGSVNNNARYTPACSRTLPSLLYHLGGREGTALRKLLKCFPALLSYEQ